MRADAGALLAKKGEEMQFTEIESRTIGAIVKFLPRKAT